ncbi:MAG: phosphoenolpyruvate--protein phosphotransferase [Deltaproteobacteria bacterium]|nr:phosphoenolpyruvate--protein phosphotransferase [Deltaproteobacteria bacterium]
MPNNTDRDHLGLLYDIGELSLLIRESTDIPNLLERTAKVISQHLNAEVCSIYLHDQETGELVLKATQGLNPASIEKVRMAVGSGLVGATLESLEPVLVGDAPQDPRFKYFAETGEGPFRSFLAVPIQRGEVRTGVLVVQHSTPDYFAFPDVRTLRAVASQVAGVLENVRLLMSLRQRDGVAETALKSEPGFVKGRAASPGFAFGDAVVFDRSHVRLLETEDAPLATEADFHDAVAATARQLDQLQERFTERLPESASLIFSAHLMMLKDAQFTRRIVAKIHAGTAVSQAVREVARDYIRLFGESPHRYLREKAKDIEDLTGRILKNLAGQSWDDQGLYQGRVVIAQALYPSEILKFASEKVAGIVLTSGGVTSHVAILARTLGIPLIIAGQAALLAIAQDTPILMDGELGNVYIQPDRDIIERFSDRERERRVAADHAGAMQPETFTGDGVRVILRANINLLSEASIAGELKAEGIGLYRTEFPFLIRSTFPGEEEEFRIYRRLCADLPGRLLTFRTLDIAGEKVPAYWDIAGEPNPQLGLRSIRFSLRHPEQFRQQIRAILRAGADTPQLRIMFPMISSLDEFYQARAFVDESREALEREGLPHHPSPSLGVMVEVPAVVEIIEELAEAADFLSIGTNDFVQYLLGVDRTNDQVAYAYRPEHPSVLRTLQRIADAAGKAGKEVSVCGEMAADLDLMPFLVGIGIPALSVDPHHLPELQSRINALTFTEAKAYAARLLAEATLAGTQAVIRSGVRP